MENTTTQKPNTDTIKRQDIYQLVTDTIIEQLESGTVPWQKPWDGTDNSLLKLPENYMTGKKYRGINILLLWGASLKHNYTASEWGSFKQWQQKKEAVRKGEKGSMIVYYDTIEREVDGDIQKIPFLKKYYVFNRSQLAGYEEPKVEQSPHVENLVEKIDLVDAFIQNTNVIVEHKYQGACFIPSADKIIMPHQEKFQEMVQCTATEGYYSTLLHELTHWTGTKDRMNRIGGKRFGDNNYATEELVAEFGAAFMCAGFGILTLEKGDHASYIDHWVKALKENKYCVVTAASEASKAVDYLHGLQPKTD